jgi:hypothetical protein
MFMIENPVLKSIQLFILGLIIIFITVVKGMNVQKDMYLI